MSYIPIRRKTRASRRWLKRKHAKQFPIYLAAPNLNCDKNVGSLIRVAGCFGASGVFVIGSVPHRKKIKSISGSLVDDVPVTTFNNPHVFLQHVKDNNMQLISAELSEESIPLHNFEFSFSEEQPLCIFVGHENFGVPGEVLLHSDTIVEIEMPGIGWCLNTAMTANIVLYEAVKVCKNKNT